MDAASAEAGDARTLRFQDESADAVLLLGPRTTWRTATIACAHLPRLAASAGTAASSSLRRSRGLHR